MTRSIVAVVAGLVVTVVAAAITTLLAAMAFRLPLGAAAPPVTVPAAYVVSVLALSLLSAAAGGGVAAAIASARPVLHAAVLGVMLALLELPALGRRQVGHPPWYPLALLALAAVGAIGGGMLLVAWRARRAASSPNDTPGAGRI